jgi:RNA-binding protein YhbY
VFLFPDPTFGWLNPHDYSSCTGWISHRHLVQVQLLDLASTNSKDIGQKCMAKCKIKHWWLAMIGFNMVLWRVAPSTQRSYHLNKKQVCSSLGVIGSATTKRSPSRQVMIFPKHVANSIRFNSFEFFKSRIISRPGLYMLDYNLLN